VDSLTGAKKAELADAVNTLESALAAGDDKRIDRAGDKLADLLFDLEMEMPI